MIRAISKTITATQRCFYELIELFWALLLLAYFKLMEG